MEDNEFFRRGLRSTLSRRGFVVAAEADSGEAGVALAASLRPDVVIMDLHLPGISGAEAVERIASAPAAPPVVMLTVSTRSADLHAALVAGAAGYLLKDSTGEEIAEALRGVLRGEARLSPEMTGRLVDRVRELGPTAAPAAGAANLTARETEVLQLLARGRDNREIGATLHISPHTVKTHVAAILDKLGAENRVQAATVAVRRGLV